MSMKWEQVYDIRASTNIRGENVYDVYRKDTDDMIWADIPVEQIDKFLKGAVDLSERVITEQMDDILSSNEQVKVDTENLQS